MVEYTERQADLHRLQTDHLSRYRWACQWATGGRCLDLGCGTGYGSRILASSGAVMVTGMDISDDAVGIARSYGELRNLEFCAGDATSSQLANYKYDLVTCFEVIEHVADPAAILSQIRSLIADNGVALVSTPNADLGYSDNPFHLSEMRSQEFRTLVSGHFSRTTWFGQFDPSQRWLRSDWERKIIRSMPMGLRKLRRAKAPRQLESNQTEPYWQKFDCRHPFCYDNWYPLPWEVAMEIMYDPPPPVILVAAQA